MSLSGGYEAARSLAWTRIALGTLFLLRTTPALVPLGLPFTADTYPLLGWPTAAFRGAALWGLEVPASSIAVLCVVRSVAALCFTLGYRTAWAGVIAGLSGYVLLLQQPFGFNFTLHLLYQGVILVGLTDAPAALALRPVPAKNPASSALLIRAFLASIYFWAGVVKLRADWLDGRTLAVFLEEGAFLGVLADRLLGSAALRSVFACSIVFIELSLPVLLFAPRTRRWAPLLALGLHASIEIVAAPDLLGWAMAALLLSTLPRSSA